MGSSIAGSDTGTGGTAITVPSSPVAIGPGLVMAQDNTLGADSPYEGRIYAAFVGYINVTIDGVKNPASNTDIFLTYSDDDGRTWSTPVEVNDDSSDTDGLTGANETNLNDEVTGKSQYPAGGRRGPDDRDPGHVLARRPQRPRRTPWWRPTSPPASTAATPSAPRSTPTPR